MIFFYTVDQRHTPGLHVRVRRSSIRFCYSYLKKMPLTLRPDYGRDQIRFLGVLPDLKNYRIRMLRKYP